ncbi:MAG: TonB-dependent receptor [Muribaculaceae bacterium]|nr:TonB-dependent receptor [Muribaculaceae bacterium]
MLMEKVRRKLCRLHSLWFAILLCLVVPEVSFAQNITVSGTVVDNQDEPLIGASVQVKNKRDQAVVTDVDGNFTLRNVKAGSTIVVSYIGFKSIELKAEPKMRVVLESSQEQLDEMVVIGYGQQRKVTLTGSVANVGGKELLKSPAASLGNALSGKLPGLQSVQYTGVPGADDPVIRIRGVGSFNSAEPLVLVDGVEREFSQIDPNEVQDISILKDASATAVFGVRGANGVILVTTRRGEKGKPNVSVSVSAGLQQISRFLEPANSYEYATAYNHAQEVEGVDKSGWKYSDEAIQHWKDMDMPTVYPSTNWFTYLMNDHAWQEQYNINVSGGSDRARYFVSVGMLNQDGLFKTFDQGKDANFKYRRYNYRANLDIDIDRYNTVSIGIGGRIGRRNSIGNGEYNGQSGVFGVEGLLNNGMPMSGYGLDSEGRRIVSDPALVGQIGSDGLGLIYQQGYTTQRQNVVNLDLNYKLKLDFITPGLDFRIKGSYNSDYTVQKARTTYGSQNFKATIAQGEFEEDGSPKIVYVRQGETWPTGYNESKWSGRNWYAEASLNYSRRFGDHNVGALVLYNESKNYYPGGVYNSIPRGYVGMVGRVTYDYQTKYMIDLNMGYNGSENFAKKKRFGFFPSASLGWIASSEKFWEPIRPVVSYFKLRASVGKVGNDNGIGRFLYLPGTWRFYTNNGGAWWTNDRTGSFGINNNAFMNGAREETNGNPDVTWETATKQNYGFDLRFFKDRLSISADFFTEDRKNILVSNTTTIAGITALKPSSVNFGRVKNHGYEIQLRWADRIGDVNYSISPSFSFARNKVIEMAEVKKEFEHMYQKGHPVGQPFGYDFFEFYVPGETEEHYKAAFGVDMPDQQITLRPGDSVFCDLTGDGKVDANDVHAIGYSDIPEYTGSINATLNWKGLDFSMTWVGAAHVNRQLSSFYTPAFGTGNQSMLNKWVYDNSWTEDNPDAILPRISLEKSAREHNGALSKPWMVDASYIRLKNVEIGYSFRIPGVPVNSIRVYANGYNLLTFTSFKANDPEAQAGYGSTRYPMTRVYNFGLNFNF